MAFTLDQFSRTRPYLYHLTSERNANKIINERVLQCAAECLRLSGQSRWLRVKRNESVTVGVNGDHVDLRDQLPLYPGKILFEGGWTFAELVRQLNRRVFFWPGKLLGPISYGIRHFERYEDEGPVILRVETAALFASNSRIVPEFCKYNSGSPRTTQGIGSPRGPSTFVGSHVAAFSPSKVVEVTYTQQITLPAVIESSTHPNGPWTRH